MGMRGLASELPPILRKLRASAVGARTARGDARLREPCDRSAQRSRMYAHSGSTHASERAERHP